MRLKDLCKEAHQAAVDKGFWDGTTSKELREQFGYPKDSKVACRNVAELLMLCVTELAEACEALRKGNRQKKVFFDDKVQINDWQKDTAEDELADTFIRLADMCEALDIDIEWQIKKKLEYNKSRPYRHGKKF